MKQDRYQYTVPKSDPSYEFLKAVAIRREPLSELKSILLFLEKLLNKKDEAPKVQNNKKQQIVVEEKTQDNLINEKQAAEHLGFTIRALQNWRLNGKGPAFVRISSRAIRYRMSDLEQWTAERIKKSTSEE